MSRCAGVLLLILALTLAEPKIREFMDWVKRRYNIMKRCQYRRKAIRTNKMLYKHTGDSYYMERVETLRKKVK